MMNKSLRGYGEESSGKAFYGFRAVGPLPAKPRHGVFERWSAGQKRAAVSGGF
jgi:hypothetical protein